MPDYSQIPCREIPNRVHKIRVYKRLPRKLKKQIKRREQSIRMMEMAINAATQVINMWRGIGIDIRPNL